MNVVGRLLTCTKCGAHVDVLEARHGACTDLEHQFLNPDTYVCGNCLTANTDLSPDDRAVELTRLIAHAREAQRRTA